MSRFAQLLEQMRAAVGEGVPLSVEYHPDADPGDGSGWLVMIGDCHYYGSAEEALTKALAGLHIREVPDAR